MKALFAPTFFLLLTLSLSACRIHQSHLASEADTASTPHERALKEMGETLLPNFPFDYCRDGCYARSYIMQAVLAKHQVANKSLFVFGPLFPTPNLIWRYHVAPMIEWEGKPMIIDPTLRALQMEGDVPAEKLMQPMEVEQWVAASGRYSPNPGDFRLALVDSDELPKIVQNFERRHSLKQVALKEVAMDQLLTEIQDLKKVVFHDEVLDSYLDTLLKLKARTGSIDSLVDSMSSYNILDELKQELRNRGLMTSLTALEDNVETIFDTSKLLAGGRTKPTTGVTVLKSAVDPVDDISQWLKDLELKHQVNKKVLNKPLCP